jgi:hypothetical protein
MAPLRDRLLALRDDLRQRLVKADTLAACWHCSPIPKPSLRRSTAMPEPTARAVVSDDGSTIWLTAYTEAGDAVPVGLLPARAVALARELLTAAVPKIGNVTAKASVTRAAVKTKPIKRRGGDPRAEQRRELHGGIREMASLLGLGSGKPAADVAREIVDHCNRYQPLPVETDPVRREMLRVRNAGVPLPASERHMVRIISGRTSNDIQ